MSNKNPEDDIIYLATAISAKLNQLKESKSKDPSWDETQLRQELWELSKKLFILKANNDPEFKKYRGIIFTVGFSPEPIILNILASEPEFIYFIYTEKSERYIDVVIEETKIKPSQYQKALIPRDSAADSYRLVKKGLNFFIEEKGIKKEDIALDPTGGTKIMSVGCGIASSIFDLNILYINNERYNPVLRRPEPGSEVLVRVPNPFDIYQDDKIYDGLKYLNSLNFSLAKDVFNNIKSSSRNPLFPELIASIAEILYHWDAINYSGALKSITKVREIIQKLSVKLSKIQKDLINIINSWEEYLRLIDDRIKMGKSEVEKISELLIFDIKANADREFYKDDYNAASLKYYRTVEMINQYILLRTYNLDTQDPRYQRLPQTTIQELLMGENSKDANLEKVILARYNTIWRFLYEKAGKKDEFKEGALLPHKIGLFAGTIMRHIFGDALIGRDLILNVFTAIEKRNMSIFAHGIVSISKKNCEPLKKIAEVMIKGIEIDKKRSSKVFNRSNMKRLTELITKII
ncbi:MAG: hypothetical protein ACTSR8_21650 [Promethearchaeota archaeon]